MTTDEMEKPLIDAPTEKCHWWSKRTHCFHEVVCSCDVAAGTCIHRACCWCGRAEKAELTAAGHGAYIPDKKNQTLIWSSWNKIVYGGSGY